MDWLAVQTKLREMEHSLAAIGGPPPATRDPRVALRSMERALLEHELKEWDEALHPRGEGGRFAPAGSSSNGHVALTLKPRWKSSRAALDTAHLTARGKTVDPPTVSAATAEQRMLDLYDRAILQGHASDANWYVDRHNTIGKWADDLGVDRQRFTDAVAATSPLTAWDLPNSSRMPNLEAARAMVQAERAHPEMTAEQIRAITPHTGGYPFIGQSAENAVRALRGEDPNDVFNANKIRSFNNNLSHPESPFDVTVDTHMGRAMLNAHEETDENLKNAKTLIEGRKIGRGANATTVGGYGWAADRIRNAAGQRKLLPSAFQAVVWEQWRREGGGQLAAKKMTDTPDQDPDNLTEEQVWQIWQDIIEWAKQGAPEDWKPDDQKANPYHDEAGRFTYADTAGFVSSWGKPKEGAVGLGSYMSEDYSPERMRAKREAMISEADRRSTELTNRMKAVQAEYDKVGHDYQNAVDIWSGDRDMVGSLPKSIEDAKAAGDAQAVRDLEADQVEYGKKLDESKAELDRQMHNMDVTQDKFWATKHEVDAGRYDLASQMRAKFIDSPLGPGKLGITAQQSHYVQRPDGTWVQDVSTPKADVPEHWQKGMQAINAMVGDVMPPGATAKVREMDPHDPWFRSGRSYHNSTFGVTMHPDDSSASTMVHEMGHWMEDNIPNLGDRIQEHIVSRTRTEAPVSLKAATGLNFNDNEVARLDLFADPYMGKDYGNSPSARTSHEFLSMSLQLMHDDPVKFAKQDPQSFDFTNRILAEARANKGRVAPPQP